MATRFYFNEAEAAAVSPTISGTDWAHIEATPVRRRLRAFSADASTLVSQTITPDSADHIADQNALWRQYVSDPLGAQTISGNVVAQLQCFEANAGNNLKLAIKIYLCSSTGTVGATLLAITRDADEIATALTNQTFASVALTSQTASANDRLVVEVGLGGLPTAAGGVQGHNGTLRFGGSASSGDLGSDQTQTGTTFRPWIEFTASIFAYQGTTTLDAPASDLAGQGGIVFEPQSLRPELGWGRSPGQIGRPGPARAGLSRFRAFSLADREVAIVGGPVTGTGDVSAASALAASALEVFSGGATLAPPASALAGSGLEVITGTATIAPPASALAAAGLEVFSGSASIAPPVSALAGSGLEVFTGTG